MENEPLPPEPTRIEEAIRIINAGREGIESKFEKVAMTSWMRCFTDILFALQLEVGSPSAEKDIGTPAFQRINEKLSALRVKHDEMKKSYPDREHSPPPDEKERLFALLEEVKVELEAD